MLGVGLEDAAVEEVGAQRVDMGDEDPRAEGAVALVLGFGFWAEGRDESEFFPPLLNFFVRKKKRSPPPLFSKKENAFSPPPLGLEEKKTSKNYLRARSRASCP